MWVSCRPWRISASASGTSSCRATAGSSRPPAAAEGAPAARRSAGSGRRRGRTARARRALRQRPQAPHRAQEDARLLRGPRAAGHQDRLGHERVPRLPDDSSSLSSSGISPPKVLAIVHGYMHISMCMTTLTLTCHPCMRASMVAAGALLSSSSSSSYKLQRS